MPAHQPYPIMLSPGEKVEVDAPDVTAAITAARDALPHLRVTGNEWDEALPEYDGDVRYKLSCLLCGVVNPRREGRSALVALQEHLMEEHGYTQVDFRTSVRVFMGTEEMGCYVCARQPGTSALPQLSYMRSVRYAVMPMAAGGREYTTLTFTHPCDGSQTRQDVYLIDHDAVAWYGYPRGSARSGAPLVWPKPEWESEDSSRMAASKTTLVSVTTLEELRCLADHTLGRSPLEVTIRLRPGLTSIRHLKTCDPLPEGDEDWWWMESPADSSESWYTDGELLNVTDIGEALAAGTLFVEAEDAAARRAAACAAARAYHLWCNTCLRDYYVPVAQGFNCPKDEEHDTGMVNEGMNR